MVQVNTSSFLKKLGLALVVSFLKKLIMSRRITDWSKVVHWTKMPQRKNVVGRFGKSD